MIFSLPMPPSINKAYITVGKYRRLSPIARAWYKEAEIIINVQRSMNNLYRTECGYQHLISDMVRVRGDFYFKYPKKCDTSNYVKLLWDSLQKNKVIRNDNMIYEEKLVKFETEGAPHVDIHLEYLDESNKPNMGYTIAFLFEKFMGRLRGL